MGILYRKASDFYKTEIYNEISEFSVSFLQTYW